MQTSSASDGTLDTALADFKKMYESLRKQAKYIKKKNLVNFAKDLRTFYKEAHDVYETMVGINRSSIEIDFDLLKEGTRVQKHLGECLFVLANDLKRYEPASLKNLTRQNASFQGQLSVTVARDVMTVIEDEVIVFLKKYLAWYDSEQTPPSKNLPSKTEPEETLEITLPANIADVPARDQGTLALLQSAVREVERIKKDNVALETQNKEKDKIIRERDAMLRAQHRAFQAKVKTIKVLEDELDRVKKRLRDTEKQAALTADAQKRQATMQKQAATITQLSAALKQTKEHLEAVQHFEALGKHLNDGYRYFLDASNDVALTTAISHLTKYAFENLVEAVARNRQGDDQRARLMYANLYTITGKLRRYQGRTIHGFAEAYEMLLSIPDIETFAAGIEPDDTHPDHKQFQKTKKFVFDWSKGTLNLSPFYYEIDASGRVFGIG